MFQWLKNKVSGAIEWLDLTITQLRQWQPSFFYFLPAHYPDKILDEKTLKNIPDSLRHINFEDYYLSLYNQLGATPTGHAAQDATGEKQPLLHRRLIVKEDGIIALSETYERKKITYTPDEARKVVIALFQLAYASSRDGRNHAMLIDSIAHFFMRPFVSLYGTEELRKMNLRLEQLAFSLRRKEQRRDSNEHPRIVAARTIQRAFRRFKFLKGPKAVEESSETLIQSMVLHGVSQNPQAPSSRVFTVDDKKEWVKTAKPEYKSLALRLAMYLVTYRSHKKFMGRLLQVIGQFNEYIHSLPMDNQDYVFVVPDKKGKSNQWVTGLALPHLVKKPLAILNPNEIEQFKCDNPTLQHLVYLDDGFYSGRQMRGLMGGYGRTQPTLHQILILPFYSKRIDRRDAQCIVGELMLTPEDMECDERTSLHPFWLKEDSHTLDRLISNTWSSPSRKTGTFFQHRVADNASTYLSDLRPLNEKGERLIPFECEKRTPY